MLKDASRIITSSTVSELYKSPKFCIIIPFRDRLTFNLYPYWPFKYIYQGLGTFTVKKYMDQNPARTRTTPECTAIGGFSSRGHWPSILLDENPDMSGWSKKCLLYSFLRFSNKQKFV